jgi:succinate-acetate transporter protein
MTLGGFLEFILGNTFPFVVFCSFGAFWLTFGATLQPIYNAYGAYGSPTATTQAETLSTGLASPGFNASFGFFALTMGILCFIYLICSLRTNVVFVVIFLSLVIGFSLLTGVYFQAAMGTNPDLTARLLVVSLSLRGLGRLKLT